MPQTIVLATATSAEGEILQKQFTSAGFEVYLVENEDAALDVLRQTPTDLLVIEDVITLDGKTIIQAVRSDARLFPVPILIVSREPTSEEIVDYLSTGADDVISPFQPRVIVARVRAILRRQK